MSKPMGVGATINLRWNPANPSSDKESSASCKSECECIFISIYKRLTKYSRCRFPLGAQPSEPCRIRGESIAASSDYCSPPGQKPKTDLSLVVRVVGVLGVTISSPPSLAQNDSWPNEISGAARLPDGKIVFIDDDEDATFLWDNDSQHVPKRQPLPFSISDIEGIAADLSGTIYLLASHSITDKGDVDPRRRLLVQMGTGFRDCRIVRDLTDTLISVLATSVDKLDLEGLAWYPDEQLLLGVRSPLHAGRAVVIRLWPSGKLFDERASGDFTQVGIAVDSLNLNGRGIRSLDYDPWRRAVVVLAGPAGRGASRPLGERFALFLWRPETGEIDSLAAIDLATFDQPEAVVVLGGPDVSTGEQELIVASEGREPLRIMVKTVQDSR